MKILIKHIILFVLLLTVTVNGFGQRGYKQIKSIKKINGEYSNELGLTILPDGSILFSSNRRCDALSVYRAEDNTYFYNLFISHYDGKRESWSSPDLFSKDLVFNDNISWPSITKDGKTLFYVKTNENCDTVSGIYFSKLQGKDSWSQPEAYTYNNTAYNLLCPYITPDGNTLYFSANNPEGNGGFDIYLSRRKGNSWSKPENLGAVINTKSNEITPFYHPSGKLFFSSNSSESRGGYDVFSTEKVNNEWIKPVPEVARNTRRDEFGWTFNEGFDTLFYITNRDGTEDIKQLVSSAPIFDDCPMQVEETFCYLFEEPGAMDLDTTTLRYEWDFGDGTKERKVTVKHCFAEPGFYFVQLNVIDTLTNEVYFGQASYDLLVEEVEQPYIIAPDSAYLRDRISFDGTQSAIKSFEIEDYYWDFRDGNTEDGVQVKHEYEEPGTYFTILGVRGKDKNGQLQKKCVQRKIVILEEEQ